MAKNDFVLDGKILFNDKAVSRRLNAMISSGDASHIYFAGVVLDDLTCIELGSMYSTYIGNTALQNFAWHNNVE